MDRQFLVQRTEVPITQAPDSLTIVSADRRPAPGPSTTFSDDGNRISGAWQKGLGGADWEREFALTYRRAS